MQLIEINKARYRKHLNRVIIACIILLAAGSLGIAQILIALFPDPSGSHFRWNLLGVILTTIAIALVLKKYRNHDYMTEIVYVWELKKALNQINRKMLKLKEAAQHGNVEALLALQYSYDGSRLLWKLDDNTIVMDDLAIAQAEVNALCAKFNVSLKVEDYDPSTLKNFK
jgi:hypothetical protein